MYSVKVRFTTSWTLESVDILWGLQEAQAEKEAALAREKAAIEQESQRLASQNEQFEQHSAQVSPSFLPQTCDSHTCLPGAHRVVSLIHVRCRYLSSACSDAGHGKILG